MSKQFYKRCGDCWQYFPAEFLSIQIYCDKCKNKGKTEKRPSNQERYINRIKRARFIRLSNFDIYDLERPLKDIKGFERVCRYCGEPLKKVDGSYSSGKRYCKNKEHNGDDLFEKFNWSYVSSFYAFEIQKEFKKKIIEKMDKIKVSKDYFSYFTVCEECGDLCRARERWHKHYAPSGLLHSIIDKLDVINVHHIQPVYTLIEENILLIFDKKNFICLCKTCHGKRHRKKAEAPFKYKHEYKALTSWF